VPGREPVVWYREGRGKVGEECLAEGMAAVLEGDDGGQMGLEGARDGLVKGVVWEGSAHVECSDVLSNMYSMRQVQTICLLLDIRPFLSHWIEFFDTLAKPSMVFASFI